MRSGLQNARCQGITGDPKVSRKEQEIGLRSLKISMLAEIAAQLAEANENRITLRDQFAMSALNAVLRYNLGDGRGRDLDSIAGEAYRWADGMLRQRETEEGK